MSLLGEYRKQPVEVEVYGIQFVKDMTETDQIESGFQMISRDSDAAWDQVVQSAPYTALLTDDGRILVTSFDVTLPADAPDTFHLCVANQSQSAAITVEGIAVLARGSTVVLRKNGAWVEEAKTNAVLVDSVGDQRMRVWVYKGTPWEMYKVQVTVSTSEGRTMQDEFTVEIEEV